MTQKNIFWTLVLCIFPFTTNAAVLFSEIAWMGTDEDANNEWIEIYNFSNTPTDLTGWTLTSEDGALAIQLAGTLSPHGVAVLERTDDSTLPNVSAFLTYTGGLSNEGRTLTIKDQSGTISDQAVGGDNWSGIGGSNTVPKKTAQRTRTASWVTAAPTPGAQNAEVSDVADSDTTTQTTSTTDTSEKKTTTKSSGGGKSSPKTPLVPGVLTLSIDAPTVAYVNQSVSFEAQPDGVGKTLINSLEYTWNFGDTNTGAYKNATHVYTYPGEYVVYLEGSFAKQRATTRYEIEVLATSFEITRTPVGDILLKNKAPYEVDLSMYRLQGATTFVFPKNTFIKAQGTLTIPGEKIGRQSQTITLIDTERVRVAVYGDVKETVQALAALPVPYSAPLARQTVSLPEGTVQNTQASLSDVSVPVEMINAQEVVQIGAPHNTDTQDGFFGRIFKKIASIFGR